MIHLNLLNIDVHVYILYNYCTCTKWLQCSFVFTLTTSTSCKLSAALYCPTNFAIYLTSCHSIDKSVNFLAKLYYTYQCIHFIAFGIFCDWVILVIWFSLWPKKWIETQCYVNHISYFILSTQLHSDFLCFMCLFIVNFAGQLMIRYMWYFICQFILINHDNFTQVNNACHISMMLSLLWTAAPTLFVYRGISQHVLLMSGLLLCF